MVMFFFFLLTIHVGFVGFPYSRTKGASLPDNEDLPFHRVPSQSFTEKSSNHEDPPPPPPHTHTNIFFLFLLLFFVLFLFLTLLIIIKHVFFHLNVLSFLRIVLYIRKELSGLFKHCSTEAGH